MSVIRMSVGDERTRRRPPAGTDGNVMVLCPVDKIGNDQEIAGEPHLVDAVQLDPEPLEVGSLVGPGKAGPAGPDGGQPRHQPIPGILLQARFQRLTLRRGVERENGRSSNSSFRSQRSAIRTVLVTASGA